MQATIVIILLGWALGRGSEAFQGLSTPAPIAGEPVVVAQEPYVAHFSKEGKNKLYYFLDSYNVGLVKTGDYWFGLECTVIYRFQISIFRRDLPAWRVYPSSNGGQFVRVSRSHSVKLRTSS